MGNTVRTVPCIGLGCSGPSLWIECVELHVYSHTRAVLSGAALSRFRDSHSAGMCYKRRAAGAYKRPFAKSLRLMVVGMKAPAATSFPDCWLHRHQGKVRERGEVPFHLSPAPSPEQGMPKAGKKEAQGERPKTVGAPKIKEGDVITLTLNGQTYRGIVGPQVAR